MKTFSVQVRLMYANDLRAANFIRSTSDPYAVLTLVRTQEIHTTSYCLNTINPTWYHTELFRNVLPSDVLSVKIYDKNFHTHDIPIGTADISIGSALSHSTAVASEAAFNELPTFYASSLTASVHSAPPSPHTVSYPTFEPPLHENPLHEPSSYEPSAPPLPPTPRSSQSLPHAPSYYPTPSDQSFDKRPPPPVLSDTLAQVHARTADANMQRMMNLRYDVAPLGSLSLIVAPAWLDNLGRTAPVKPYKKFQIHEHPTHGPHAPKTSMATSVSSLVKKGVEKTRPLQNAVNILQPIQAVFQEYSTWKITLLGVLDVFGDKRHSWNRHHVPAQKIFSGKTSLVTRRAVQMQHAYLYGGGSGLKPVQNMRKEMQEVTGNLLDSFDFLQLLNYGIRRGKPRMFTYVLMPNRLYVAETGAKFFRDIMSKHAMHSSASAEVVYAGEMHFRRASPGSNEPDMRLIVDNNSGTYSPGREDLPKVEDVFRRNFPGLSVTALHFQDPLLKQYIRDIPPHIEEHY